MIPRLAAQGASFEGAYLYYFHDKNARTQARVAWTETLNMLTDKVEKAWKVMAYTARHQERLKEASNQKRSGAKLKKAVLAYSLSWHPEQKPDRATMMEAARTSLADLGLEEHEAMIACHIDEPQPHIHIVVNKVHPRTGLVAALKHTKRKLSDWARKFQRDEGTTYCPQREKNHQKRKKGMSTQYGDPVIINAWKNSRDAAGFAAALVKDGYRLEHGRKRLIVIDPHGKAHNPLRHLKGEGVRAKDFNARMKDWQPEPEMNERASNEPEPAARPDPKNQNEPQRIDEQSENLMTAFNHRAAEASFNQLERQRKEREALERRYTVEKERKTRLLEAKYKTTERQNRIDILKSKLESRNPLQRWMQKLLLQDRKLTRTLNKLEAKQAEARTRIANSLDRLAADHSTQSHSLENRQSRERRLLEKRLESWRPRTLPSNHQSSLEIQQASLGLHR